MKKRALVRAAALSYLSLFLFSLSLFLYFTLVSPIKVEADVEVVRAVDGWRINVIKGPATLTVNLGGKPGRVTLEEGSYLLPPILEILEVEGYPLSGGYVRVSFKNENLMADESLKTWGSLKGLALSFPYLLPGALMSLYFIGRTQREEA